MIKNIYYTLVSFRSTFIAILIGAIVVKYLNFDTLITYAVAAFLSLIHPFVERYEYIKGNGYPKDVFANKNITKPLNNSKNGIFKDEKIKLIEPSFLLKIANYVWIISIVIISIIILLAVFERWPFLIDWAIPKW